MKTSFNWKIFISFGLVLSFGMLLVSGVVLFISPPGRVANWTDWRMIGLSKAGWQEQHAVFGFAFAILSACHLFFINWRAFLSYLKVRATEGLRSPGELFASLLLFLAFGVGTAYSLQPFSSVVDFGHRISASWEQQGKQAPVPHAEAMTLVELSRQPGQGGDAELLKAKLQQAGFRVMSVNETFAEIAGRNNMTAEKLYRYIAPARIGKYTLPAEGLGRRTLQDVADSSGVSAISLKLALRQKNVAVEPGMALKEIAGNNAIPMSELRQMLENIISR
ncbi:MAG: DUF4405 domain-containing protein [Chlorobiaceae bacterium]|nr:DUF4405 domain-containing protein [Chlorobiaceae bacterium]